MPEPATLERPDVELFRIAPDSLRRVRMDGEEEDDAPIRYEFSASSDEPVDMGWGYKEILDHSPGSVRLGWIGSGRAPLLWMHDRREVRGVIESAKLDGGRLTVTVRMGSSDEAKSLVRDIDEGIISNVSIGYRIHAEELVESSDEGQTWRVTDWEPKEASFVSIPADGSVGLGREQVLSRVRFLESKRDALNTPRTRHTMSTEATAEPKGITPEEAARQSADAVTAERSRVAGITAAANAARENGFGDFSERAQKAIDADESLEDFQRHVLDNMKRTPAPTTEELGLTKKETKRFSLSRLMRSIVEEDDTVAEFEHEVCRATAESMKRENPKRVAIPLDVMLRGYFPKDPATAARLGLLDRQRDLVSISLSGAGQDDTASNLVETDLLADMWIASLRENTVFLPDVTMIPGLVGDADIPVELTNPAFAWVAEDGEPAEGEYTSTAAQFRYKTIAARVPITRRALKQTTPAIDSLIANSLRIGAAIGLETAVINGAGSATVPEGILQTSGIGAVTSSSALTHAHVVELMTDLTAANVNFNGLKFYTNSTGLLALRTTNIESGDAKMVGEWVNGELIVEGMPVKVTNLVPANLGGGTDKSAIIFGDVSKVYMGMWGGLEIARDVATKAATGGVVLRAFQDADLAIPQAGYFSAIQDL